MHAGRLAVSGNPDGLTYALRATELDPKFGLAWGKVAEDRAYRGDIAGSRDAIERCLAVSPNGTRCLVEQLAYDDQERQCETYLTSADKMRQNDPSAGGLHAFANGLIATGAPSAAALEALEQSWSRIDESERSARSERDRAVLELLGGAIGRGSERLREVQEQVAAWTDPWRWLRVTAVLLEALQEQGRDAEAGRVAQDLDERLASLPTNPRIEDWAIAQSPLLRLTAAEIRAGLLEEGELDKRRERWLHDLESRVTKNMRRYLWVHGYAEHADTPERARGALAAIDRFGGIPAYRPLTATNYTIGRTMLLGGKADEALPYLRRLRGGAATLGRGHAAIDHGRAGPQRFQRARLFGSRAGPDAEARRRRCPVGVS